MKIKSTIFCLFLAICAHAQSPVTYEVVDQTFEAGDTVYAEFRVYNFTGIGAVQFCLKIDTAKANYLITDGSPLVFTGNLPGLGNGHFSWHGKPGFNLPAGQLRHVWTSASGKTVAPGLVIFKIGIKAKAAGSLSNTLNYWPGHFLHPICYKAIPLTYLGLMPLVYVAEAQELVSADAPALQGLNVYPNPSADAFFVDVPQGVTTLRFYGSDSRLLWAFDATAYQGGAVFLNNSNPPGLYFLEASGKEGSMFVKQIIKN